jgi:hypothetical protein
MLLPLVQQQFLVYQHQYLILLLLLVEQSQPLQQLALLAQLLELVLHQLLSLVFPLELLTLLLFLQLIQQELALLQQVTL